MEQEETTFSMQQDIVKKFLKLTSKLIDDVDNLPIEKLPDGKLHELQEFVYTATHL